MTIRNALAAVAVKDLPESEKWYTRLLGRPADSTPMPEVAEWKFSGGGWLQVYQSKERVGTGSFTLAVTDIAEQVAALKKIGIDPGRQMGGEKVKVVMIKDPDGNSIAFAEALDRGIAQ
jgi:catechol 2,3-dioxygenase-like lactoylglutathione lyase family enzyme